MSARFRVGLVIYFSVLIVISIFLLVLIWNPRPGSLTAVKQDKEIINGPGKNEKVIIDVKNSSLSSEKRNVTSIIIVNGNQSIRTENDTIKPLSGQAFGTDPEIVFTNPEIRLVIFATFFGIIGASIHGIGSLTAWISTNKLESGWGIWYLTRPPIGAALAVITYIILRAGFVSGGPTAISDFGVAGISALVGLMTDEMTAKLRDVFDSLFGIKKPAGEKGDDPTKRNLSSIIFPSDQKTQFKVGEEIVLKPMTTKSDGSPAAKAKVHFVIGDPNIAEFTEVVEKATADVESDSEGIAIVKVKGVFRGKTQITATGKIEGQVEEIKNSISIEVIQ